MHQFATKFKLTQDLWESKNLAPLLEESDRLLLGNLVKKNCAADLQSRTRWEARTQAAMDLALQVVQTKNFPWPNCANIALPLVTIAALQFHARAYPALVQAPNLVKCRVEVPDPSGQVEQAASLIGKHMSWQLLEQDESWEEQHDRLLLNMAIVGCAFKKTYFREHNRSELVLANDMIVDYWSKSIETAGRKTHRMKLSRNSIFEGVRSGIYVDVIDEDWFRQPPAVTAIPPSKATTDNRQGLNEPQPDADTPFTVLEQHLSLDLDDDGYAEPYIATVEQSTGTLLRLVTRWEGEGQIDRNQKGQLVRIQPTEYFTKYGFIPSPDGGIYDVGFGMLLGPLNESANSILNQLVDAGTMANTKGGFLGRGVKVRGGNYTFAPLEWKRIDSTGDDIKKNIFPLPVGEPSNVLFQLLQLLIDFTMRTAGATDAVTGQNPGQNTPAQTQQSMVEQGLKIYSAIYKRVWRSMKEEFKKLYRLNQIYLPAQSPFGSKGDIVLKELYLKQGQAIIPAADPNVVSDVEAVRKAMGLLQLSQGQGGFDHEQVMKRVLVALKVDSPEQVYPGLKAFPQPPNPRVAVEMIRQQAKQAELQSREKQFLFQLQEQHTLNQAKILELAAQAESLQAQADQAASGHQLAIINSSIALMKQHDEQLRAHIELALRAAELESKHEQQQSANPGQAGGGLQGMASAPGNAALPSMGQ